ncbi:MAG: hypothetical protein DMD48_12485 [Gemmatimonadetes bacterium]|nr:MAG: hypothetical protein DMD48_12485 [Gemmatimonadota bacterium]
MNGPTVQRSNFPSRGRLLAVDWGQRRIGLALSDETQTLAQPLATLTRRAGKRLMISSVGWGGAGGAGGAVTWRCACGMSG